MDFSPRGLANVTYESLFDPDTHLPLNFLAHFLFFSVRTQIHTLTSQLCCET